LLLKVCGRAGIIGGRGTSGAAVSGNIGFEVRGLRDGGRGRGNQDRNGLGRDAFL
jgi:hypothetical protein